MRVDNVRKDLIQFEDEDIILCYSDHTETLTELKFSRILSVNHGWFIILKDNWEGINIPDEMIKVISNIQFER